MDEDSLREIRDPRVWARLFLREAPDQVAYLEAREFDEGTFGAWVKSGLRAEEGAHTLAMLEESWNASDIPEPDSAGDEEGAM